MAKSPEKEVVHQGPMYSPSSKGGLLLQPYNNTLLTHFAFFKLTTFVIQTDAKLSRESSLHISIRRPSRSLTAWAY